MHRDAERPRSPNQAVAPPRTFFRSYAPGGYCLPNRSAVAERVTALPALADLAGLAAPEWFAGDAALRDFFDLWGNGRQRPATAVRVLCGDEGLFVGARMEEPHPERMRGLVPAGHPETLLKIEGAGLGYPPERDDNLQIAIDPTHEARQYFQFLVTHRGYGHVRAKQYAYNESVHPSAQGGELQQSAGERDVKAGWSHRVLVAPGGERAWYAFLRIPWAALGLNGAPSAGPLGFEAVRVRTDGELVQEAWTPVSDSNSMVALDFGDLYLGASPVTLEEIAFGLPVLAENELQVRLAAPAARVAVQAEVEVRRQRTGETIYRTAQPATLDIPAGGTAAARLPYTLDWREPLVQELRLTLRDAANGAVLHRSLYELGRFAQIPTEDQHRWDAPRSNPAPDHPDFVAAKRNWLLARLPRFVRRTTAQGAPSDFCVECEDGQVCFNLMRPDACRQIAAYVETQFENDLDRMAAASLLVHQKVFAMHCGPLTSMHKNFTPESALRLNGGHCYSRALALAGVLREIRYAGGPRKGQAYDATIVFVLGHVIVRVRENDENILFDPTFGSFFYTHDNTRFATERELGADLTLADRYIVARHKDYFHPASHAASPLGNVVWPAGAPGPRR